MKQIYFLISAFMFLFMTASCGHDNNNEDTVFIDNNYEFSFVIELSDIYNNNLLSYVNSGDSLYNADNISIKSLQEDDNVTFKTVVNQTSSYSAGLVADETNSARLLVDVDSYGADGIIKHDFVIQWDKNNNKKTDTITCEIYKNNNNITLNSLLVNNIRNPLSDGYFPQTIRILKVAPSLFNVIDKNNNETLIEKEVDGIKFSFWLSDMDDNITNIFDANDVCGRGLKFNMSLTNNTDQNIFIDDKGDVSRYLRNVFDIDNNYIGRNYIVYQDILAIAKIQPGETHHESVSWMVFETMTSYDISMPYICSLPAGKYFTYFCKSFTYEHGDNYDIFDHSKTNTTRKTIDVPLMYINFEVK